MKTLGALIVLTTLAASGQALACNDCPDDGPHAGHSHAHAHAHHHDDTAHASGHGGHHTAHPASRTHAS